jgi:hypothetical protein
MQELIERLEKASGPLDDGGVALLIATLNGKTLRKFAIATGDAGEDEMQIYCTDGTTLRASSINEYPDRSLDAAMSYVPEGWHIDHIGQNTVSKQWAVILYNGGPMQSAQSWGQTSPAIALCIAALKAQQGTTRGE